MYLFLGIGIIKNALYFLQIVATAAFVGISFCEGNPLPQSGGNIRTGNRLFDLFYAPELFILNAINRMLRNGRNVGRPRPQLQG